VAWMGDPEVFGINAKGVAMNDAGTLVVQALVGSRSFTVSASGTVLPLSPQANTWTWLDIFDINDLGSMLVAYRLPNDPSNTIRKARLTANP
jgi:hypothetical protein